MPDDVPADVLLLAMSACLARQRAGTADVVGTDTFARTVLAARNARDAVHGLRAAGRSWGRVRREMRRAAKDA